MVCFVGQVVYLYSFVTCHCLPPYETYVVIWGFVVFYDSEDHLVFGGVEGVCVFVIVAVVIL